MIQSTILKSESIIQWIDSNIDGISASAEPRIKISLACFDLAHEHQKSITLLIANHLTGSALSLLRLIFEAYMRGMWFYNIATDEDIDKFVKIDKIVKKNGQDKKINELAEEVEEIDGFGRKVLSGVIKEGGWKTMNSYTHCGFMQIAGRNTTNSIEPNYNDEEKVGAIKFANALGLLSLLGMARIVKNIDLQKYILEKIKERDPKP